MLHSRIDPYQLILLKQRESNEAERQESTGNGIGEYGEQEGLKQRGLFTVSKEYFCAVAGALLVSTGALFGRSTVSRQQHSCLSAHLNEMISEKVEYLAKQVKESTQRRQGCSYMRMLGTTGNCMGRARELAD